MPELKINGAKIYYEEKGSGQPLVLISGLGSNGGAWAPVIEMLSQAYRCITFDARGTGRSDVTDGPYSIDSLADDTVALIEQLNLHRAHVVGWSMGASILQSMLIRHPQVLIRAVLLNAFPNYTPLQQAWLDASMALRESDIDRTAIAAFGMSWGLTLRILSDHQRTLSLASIAVTDPFPTSNAGFKAQAEGLRSYDARPFLSSVRTPTLVLAGAEDILTPVSQSIEIARLIPGSELKVLPRGGHRMVVEYPDDTISAVCDFLARLDA
jgi:3-oxoadipate enol-lactonase